MNSIHTARTKRDGCLADTWYVAFDSAKSDKGDYFVRNTRTFQTESEAKRFAEDRLAEGCNVSAGTLSPHYPSRTIGPSQLESWLRAD